MHRSIRLVAAVAIGLITLSGCDKVKEAASPEPSDNGVAALSGDEILAKSKAALAAAKSFRLKGDLPTDDGGKLALDIKTRESDLGGTIIMSGGPSGSPQATVEVLRVKGQAFFKADTAFWKSVGGKSGDAAVELFEGKWVRPKSDDRFFASLLKLTDPDTLLKADGTITKGEMKKIGERDAIELKDGESSLYVATKGEPHPLRIEGPPGEGQAEFSEFGAAFDEIKEPPADQVVDLAKLQGALAG
jgi:hypothetical protein